MLDRFRLPVPVAFFEAQGLDLTGKGRWRTACCPLHGGKSLRVNVESGAFACMAGCDLHGGDVIAFAMQVSGLDFVEAVKRLGAWVGGGHDAPVREQHVTKLSARDRLELLYHESMVVLVVGSDVHRDRSVSDQDYERLGVALRRIGHVAWRNAG